MLTPGVEGSMDRRLAEGRTRLLRRVRVRERLGRFTATAALLLIAGSAAAATLGVEGAHGQTVAMRVTCFDRTSLQAAHLTAALTVRQGVTDVDGAARRVCDDRWAGPSGVSGAGTVTAAVCWLSGDSVGVFRQTDVDGRDRRDCADLGLARA